jgi:undecaprenyl diphosphate synthase
MEQTADNDAMTMVVALSYSARWEITKAMKDIVWELKQTNLTRATIDREDITEEVIANHLETYFMPDPDLLIRTGGEQRISNYLLWQIAYSELYFCNTFWPDFDEQALQTAIADFQQRERRYGMTSEQIQPNAPIDEEHNEASKHTN